MGIADLALNVTINSTERQPDARYDAEDAGASTWTANTYGPSLSLSGSGSDPTLDDGSPTMGTTDTSVLQNAGKYWQAGDTTSGNVSTKDFMIAGVAKATGTTCVLLAKRNAGVGWEVGINAGDQLYLTVEDSSGSTTVVSAALTAGQWFAFYIFADRSGSAQIYINNAASGSPVSISSRSLTLDSSTALTIGADSGGNGKCDSNIAYVELFSYASWFDTHLQPDVVMGRFGRTTGFYPAVFTGTAIPSIESRSSPRYIEKYEASAFKLYWVSANWPSIHKDSDGSVYYVPESASTNKLTRSHEFEINPPAWNKYRCSISQDTTAAPDGETVADAIHEDATASATHYVEDGALSTGVGAMVWSAYSKLLNRDWIRLNQFNTTDGSGFVFFDLSTGNSGNYFDLDDYDIEDKGGGWYRAWVKRTVTIATNSVEIFIASANGVVGFDGLDQDSVYAYGGALEAATVEGPTSYIRTDGSEQTRQPDFLRYKGDDGNLNNTSRVGALALRCKVKYPDETSGHILFDLTDGGSSADRIACWINAAGVPQVASAASGGAAGAVTGSTDVADGSEHEIKVSWQDDALRLFVDGVEEGTVDTDCDLPDDLDRIDIGANYDGTWSANAHIRDVRIYDAQQQV